MSQLESSRISKSESVTSELRRHVTDAYQSIQDKHPLPHGPSLPATLPTDTLAKLFPEKYEALKNRASDFLEFLKPYLEVNSRVLGLKFEIGDYSSFYFSPSTRTIGVDIKFFDRFQGFELLLCFLHEIGHLKDLYDSALDSEYMKKFDTEQVQPVVENVVRRFWQAIEGRDQDVTIHESWIEIGERIKGGDSNLKASLEKQLKSIIRRRVYMLNNIFDDIHINYNILSDSRVQTQDFAELYNKLFPEVDLTKAGSSTQLLYRLLLKQMNPERPYQYSEVIQSIAGQPTKSYKDSDTLVAKRILPTQIATYSSKGKNTGSFKNTNPKRIETLVNEFIPIWQELLLHDILSQEGVESQSNPLSGETELTDSDGQDISGRVPDFDFDPESQQRIEDSIEQKAKVDQEIEKTKEDVSKEQVKQKVIENNRSIDNQVEAHLQQIQKEKMAKKREIFDQILSEPDFQKRRQELADFWEKFVEKFKVKFQQSVSWQSGNRTGPRLNIQSVISEYSKIQSGSYDEAEVYDRKLRDIRALPFPINLEINFIMDLSGSMEGKKMTNQQKAYALVGCSIARLQEKFQTKIPFANLPDLNYQAIEFETNSVITAKSNFKYHSWQDNLDTVVSGMPIEARGISELLPAIKLLGEPKLQKDKISLTIIITDGGVGSAEECGSRLQNYCNDPRSLALVVGINMPKSALKAVRSNDEPNIKLLAVKSNQLGASIAKEVQDFFGKLVPTISNDNEEIEE